MINRQTANYLVETAADAVRSDAEHFQEVLDRIPAPIYVTDREGTITYYNAPCVELAGRTPVTGKDKWCVTWKLYTTDGEPLPHEQCPMAITLREGKPVRDVEAIAERPDGTRFHFVPFPTPLFDADGELTGAVNLLMDVSDQRPASYLQQQAEQCRQLAEHCRDLNMAKTLVRMAAKYEEQALRPAHVS